MLIIITLLIILFINAGRADDEIRHDKIYLFKE